MPAYDLYRSRRLIEVKRLPDGRLVTREGKPIEPEVLKREWEPVGRPIQDNPLRTP